jgi:hypothetical protein
LTRLIRSENEASQHAERLASRIFHSASRHCRLRGDPLAVLADLNRIADVLNHIIARFFDPSVDAERRPDHERELSPIFGDGLIDQAAAVAD